LDEKEIQECTEEPTCGNHWHRMQPEFILDLKESEIPASLLRYLSKQSLVQPLSPI